MIKREVRFKTDFPFCFQNFQLIKNLFNFDCISVMLTNLTIMNPSSNYQLDFHCQEIIEQYQNMLKVYQKLAEVVPEIINNFFSEAGLLVASVEKRIKTEESLAGKLELKGAKYRDISDITDIFGIRVVTFYIDDVDKVASALEKLFEIDWNNSIDKRKAHEIDRFGYMSLHYICKVPRTLYWNEEFPELNTIRFEVQMRSVLQHAWANMNHDTGYKSGVEVPKVYLRNLSRLAGMLELVDDEFSRIRSELVDYRRNIQTLVASGNLSEVPLDGDSFKSYLKLDPFKTLNKKIASINQAEIQEVSLMNFLPLFIKMEFKTLGDIRDLIKDYSDAAYQIACFQLALSDIDIISSSIAPQNLCIACFLRSGSGKAGLKFMLDILNGPSESNLAMAEFLEQQSKDLPFMNAYDK